MILKKKIKKKKYKKENLWVLFFIQIVLGNLYLSWKNIPL